MSKSHEMFQLQISIFCVSDTSRLHRNEILILFLIKTAIESVTDLSRYQLRKGRLGWAKLSKAETELG